MVRYIDQLFEFVPRPICRQFNQTAKTDHYPIDNAPN